MRIAIVGGIFGQPPAYRAAVRWAPETILVDGLRRRGHEVEAIPHTNRVSLSGFDIGHVHHLSWGAIAASTDRTNTPFAFTLHASRPPRRRAAAFVMARADGVVALWPDQADAFRRRYRLSGAEVAVIPNGIETKAFSFTQPARSGNGPWKLLFVGQLIPEKGIDLLLRAIVELRARHEIMLSLTYHVDIMEEQLRALSRELKVDDIVRFLGRTPQERLGKIYRDSHVVVLPSTGGHEALPSVLTEAMLTGAFPVATDLGGIRDQVDRYGIVVPPGDVHALAGGLDLAIRSFSVHRAQAEEMSMWASRRFSVDQMVASHERLYRTILDRCVARPRRHRARVRVGTGLGRPALVLRHQLARSPADLNTRYAS